MEKILDTSTLGRIVRPQTLAEQVYNALRAKLCVGAMEPGQPVQEVWLSEQLGVSRTPVREALARLASEGLLDADRRSHIVPVLTRQDVDDIYEIRYLLEPAALRQVASLTTDAGKLAAIDAALVSAEAAHRAGDVAAFRDAHVRHRAAWLTLLPNRRLLRAIEMYVDHMQYISALTLGDARVRVIVLRGIKRLTTALGLGDGDAAAAEMALILENAKRAFVNATGLDLQPKSHGRDEAA